METSQEESRLHQGPGKDAQGEQAARAKEREERRLERWRTLAANQRAWNAARETAPGIAAPERP